MQGAKPVYGAMAGGRLKRLGFILPLYFPNQQPELCFDLCVGMTDKCTFGSQVPVIVLHTEIHAPIDRCFDLSRSIDLHKISTEHTNEEAIDGVTSGLISLNESVTWKAKHFGVYQTLTTQITEFDNPKFFVDEMTKGAFNGFRHEHHFKTVENGTLMTDRFDYQSPLGVLGKLVDMIVLKQYMTDLLIKRNLTIKEFAESDKWTLVL
ncbi:cell division protein [Fulvivirga sp. M361]|uniref:SRPBCC family protein n=1 Tax=Fulvivirga sp. M361 TaxID=2594266 RepID=UPI00351B6D9B